MSLCLVMKAQAASASAAEERVESSGSSGCFILLEEEDGELSGRTHLSLFNL